MHMKGKIHLVPGTPDEANRDYLPESIVGTDIVVNENGNNSIPYPKKLTEHTEVLHNGQPDTWYEYIPESYDGKKPVPLVVSFHGGMMTGWAQCIYTSWSYIAEREGFIVIFPTAHENRFWLVDHTRYDEKWKQLAAASPLNLAVAPEKIEDNPDAMFVVKLVELMKQRYNIDPGRVYIQGMSMGDMMTSQMARWFGNLFAGAAGSGAHPNARVLVDDEGKLLNRGGPLSYFISMPEHNGWQLNGPEVYDYETFFATVNYWRTVNGCTEPPKFLVRGEDNFAFYKGEKANIVFRDIKNRDHGQTIDDAELVWDYCFSGARKDEQGVLHCGETDFECEGDEWSVIVAEGSDKALIGNVPVQMSGKAVRYDKLKYHGLEGGELVRGSYLCLPVSFVADALEAECRIFDQGRSAELVLPDGRHVEFTRGCIGCLVENRVCAMDCQTLEFDGQLYLPFAWIARNLGGLQVSECGGVLYATDHYSELSTWLAEVIKRELN